MNIYQINVLLATLPTIQSLISTNHDFSNNLPHRFEALSQAEAAQRDIGCSNIFSSFNKTYFLEKLSIFETILSRNYISKDVSVPFYEVPLPT